ncbi:transcription cofactor vestigial-like protein 2b [Callorhinchus milii]|nr:transcription cofactor vestigial-like protein 2b [Callorhinchus milii]|eukprot:gi/632954429/ref/XP_007892959.1/ PREDICTED: transcription cofactor vestigial-like protein 2 [Callorhinchus milii]
MTCLDVMFHMYGAHHPYFTSASAFTTQYPQTLPLYPRVQEAAMEGVAVGFGHPSSSAKGESLREKGSPEAEYINPKCVLFTYFNGDISSVVDEHFTRALNNYTAEGKDCKQSKQSPEALSPLAQRTFPASFWDSNYQPPPGSATAATGGLCSPGSETYPPALPPQSLEHWHYPPLAQHSTSYHHPRTVHELYPVTPSLDPHYGSLLVPAIRSSRLPPALGSSETPTPWTGVFPTAEVTQMLNLNVDAGLQHHDKAKDLFWY